MAQHGKGIILCHVLFLRKKKELLSAKKRIRHPIMWLNHYTLFTRVSSEAEKLMCDLLSMGVNVMFTLKPCQIRQYEQVW